MEKFLFPIRSKIGAKPKLKKHFPADKFLQITSTVKEHALVCSLSLSLPPPPLMEILDWKKNTKILIMIVTFRLIKALLINPP